MPGPLVAGALISPDAVTGKSENSKAAGVTGLYDNENPGATPGQEEPDLPIGNGVLGVSYAAGGAGVLGTNDKGVGVFGASESGTGVVGRGRIYAGFFGGPVRIEGPLTATGPISFYQVTCDTLTVSTTDGPKDVQAEIVALTERVAILENNVKVLYEAVF